MPDPDAQLLALAERRVPADPGVRDCWGFVIEGIRVGWLDRGEIRELIDYLRDHHHFGVEELLFEKDGDHLRVSFLDDRAWCSPAAMLEELEALIASVP